MKKIEYACIRDLFESYSKINKKAEKTIYLYTIYCVRFLNTINKDFNKVVESDVHDYLNNCLKSCKSVSTLNLISNSLDCLFNKILNRNFKSISDFKTPIRQVNVSFLSEKEINLLIQNTNHRNQLMFYFIYHYGLNLSNVIKMNLNIINFKEKCFVLNHKVYDLSDSTIDFIKRYIKEYNIKNWLFIGNMGKPICGRAVELALKTVLKNVNLNPKFSLKNLRRSRLYHLLIKKSDIDLIKQYFSYTEIKLMRKNIKYLEK